MSKVEKYFLKSNRLGFRHWCEDDLAIASALLLFDEEESDDWNDWF